MKIQWDNKQTTIAVYAFLVIVAGSLFIAALFHIHEIAGRLGWVIALLSPFLYGFSFAYLLNPLMKWFSKGPFAL